MGPRTKAAALVVRPGSPCGWGPDDADAPGLLLPAQPVVARARAMSPSATGLDVAVAIARATVVVRIAVAGGGALGDSG